MKALWLASWYPDKTNPFNGDFVKRHAEAVSLFVPVHVLHIAKDESGKITKDVLVEETGNERHKETIVYYYSKKTGIKIIDKFLSELRFRKLAWEFSIKIIKEEKPAIIHVHTGMKMGIVAGELKRKFRLPYIVTEHWTGFLNEADDNFSKMPLVRQAQWKKIIVGADRCTAVSAYLSKAIENRFNIRAAIIPNVVNTTIFGLPELEQSNYPGFIFISTFDDFKRPELVLEAFAMFEKMYPGTRLTVFAPDRETVLKVCRQLGVEEKVDCFTEIPQPELVKYIQRSQALLLYSSYETFGCVVIEANACGVPVIVSDIPAMRELVEDGKNGIFAVSGSAEKLAEAMSRFMKTTKSFNSGNIAALAAEKFNYHKIGKQFSDLYSQVIAPKARA